MLAHGLGYLGDHGEPTAYWPVGWPLTLSLAFRAFGTSIWTIGLFNLACAGVTAWLTLDLGRRLSGSELAAAPRCSCWRSIPTARSTCRWR
jgi:hypothetical protein